MPSAISNAGATLHLAVRRGSDFTLTLVVTENGALYDWAGATITAAVLTTAGVAQSGPTFAVDTSTDGVLVLTLDDADTTALADTGYWQLDVTKSGATVPWVSGTIAGLSVGRGGSTSQGATLTLVTSAGANLAISGGVTGPPGAGSLATMSDLTLTSPVVGHIIRHNGTGWVNALGTTHFDAAGTGAAAAAAAQAASQPLDSDLTAIAALTTTAYGRAFLALANQAALVALLPAALSGTTASFTTADETKLDAIEALADVTDATNVNAAGAVMNSDTSTAAMSFVVDEDAMTSNSATKVPTQQSVKAYVDASTATAETVNTVAASGTSLSLDAAYDIHDITVTGTCTITITGAPTVRTILMRFTGDGTNRTVTLPGGNTVAVGASDSDLAVTALTVNGGTNWDYYRGGTPSTTAATSDPLDANNIIATRIFAR